MDFRSSRWYFPIFLYVTVVLPMSLVILLDDSFGRVAKTSGIVLLVSTTALLLFALRRRVSSSSGRHTRPSG